MILQGECPIIWILGQLFEYAVLRQKPLASVVEGLAVAVTAVDVHIAR